MSNVSFTIGGRRFTVACAPGEEAHVARLGDAINTRVAALGGLGGQSETRMLLFAALTLADEVHEQAALTPTAPAPDPVISPEKAPLADQQQADRLAAIAEALENLANRLEAAGDDA